MKNVSEIIEDFGGLVSLQKALGLKYPSIVAGWKSRNSIPNWRLDALVKVARERNISLLPANDNRSEEPEDVA